MAKEEKTLSEQDRKRINKSFFDKHPYSSGAGWNEYYEGAEYEHKYQREQQAELRNKVIEEVIEKIRIEIRARLGRNEPGILLPIELDQLLNSLKTK